MHLPGVHKGDDLREVLSAENLCEVFRGVNRLNSQHQQPFATAASGSVYARIFSKSRLSVGSVVRLTRDAFVSVSMDYAVCVDTPVSMDDDPHQVLGIVVKDLRAGERGKAVVSGIAIGSVNVSDTSHQFAKVENGVLVSTDEEDAPIRLISAPATGSKLCVLMLGFGNGGGKDVSSYTGPFDTSVTLRDSDEPANGGINVTIRVFNSSNPDATNAGVVYLGYRTLNIPAVEKQINLREDIVCTVFCFVYLNENNSFVGSIHTNYDDGYNANDFKTDDTHVNVTISKVSIGRKGAIVIQRERMLDSIDIQGRWF
ncbi:MAG: hypothetical protein IKS83_04110 [Victivallales bacterium]|nr:hypothetical protein [Victivallales bacterium]